MRSGAAVCLVALLLCGCGGASPGGSAPAPGGGGAGAPVSATAAGGASFYDNSFVERLDKSGFLDSLYR